MNNKLNYIHLVFALCTHIVVIGSIMMLTQDRVVIEKMIIHGAHSKTPSKAIYTKPKSPVPFVRGNNTTSSPSAHGVKKSIPKPQSRKAVQQVPVKKSIQSRPAQTIKKTPAAKVPVSIDTKNKKNPLLEKKKRSKKSIPFKAQQPKRKEEPLPDKPVIEKKDELEQKEKKLETSNLSGPEEVVAPVANDVLDLKEDLENTELAITCGGNDSALNLGNQESEINNYQRLIVQKEIDRIWNPPVGVPKGTECIITLTIKSNGNVDSFEVLQASKILIYDLSITRIIRKLNFDKCLAGKKLKLIFQQ